MKFSLAAVAAALTLSISDKQVVVDGFILPHRSSTIPIVGGDNLSLLNNGLKEGTRVAIYPVSGNNKLRQSTVVGWQKLFSTLCM